MGMFDNLSGVVKGLAGQAEAAALPALLSAALAKTDLKDMQGLLDKLQQSGLGKQVSSWLGDGKNFVPPIILMAGTSPRAKRSSGIQVSSTISGCHVRIARQSS
jgi:hypothetical protein